MPYTPDTWANNDPTKPLNAARLTKLAGQYPQVMEDLPAKIADSGDPIGAALNSTYVSVPAGIADGEVPTWDETTETWIPGTGGGGGSSKLRTPTLLGDAPFSTIGTAWLDGSIAATAGTSRTRHVSGWAGTNIRLSFINRTISSGIDIDGSAVYTVRASIRYGGVNYRATFNGSATAVIDPGGLAQTDPIGIEIPANTAFEVLTYVSASTGSPGANTTSGLAVGTGGFTATDDRTAPGATAVADSINHLYGPAAITATRLSGTLARGFVAIGDSIMHNTKETTAGVNIAVSGKAGVVKVTTSGISALHWLTPADRRYRASMIQGVTDAICNLGINDIRGSISLATMQSRIITVWNMIVNRGARVHQTTITPNTTSTDSFATLENQTLNTAPQNAVRVAFNQWLRAGAPMVSGAAAAIGTSGALLVGDEGHPCTSIINVGPATESSEDSGLWIPGRTSDGLHPNAVGYPLMYALYPIDAIMAEPL